VSCDNLMSKRQKLFHKANQNKHWKRKYCKKKWTDSGIKKV
jgi:hypothetical protein